MDEAILIEIAQRFRKLEDADALASARASGIVLRERDIQKTCCDFLRAEGWRVFEFEQQWSEKKRKTVGEKGMPDVLAIRYRNHSAFKSGESQVLWVEFKRIYRGRTTKAFIEQRAWHLSEHERGALTWMAGEDFEATIEGFIQHYRESGLARS